MSNHSEINGAQEREAWVHARKQDTLTAYLRFLSLYPNSDHRASALNRSQELEEERAWVIAQRSDRIYTYEKFMDEYPDGKYVKLAGKRILKLEKSLLKKPVQENGSNGYGQLEELAIEEATNIDSIAAYNQFLKNFPHSNYKKQVQERMHQLESRLAVQYRFLEIELQNWELADKMNTPLAYRDFLQKFPSGKFANLANQRLAALGGKMPIKQPLKKLEPENIRVNPQKSPLYDIIKAHKKEKKLEEKSAISLAYVWLGLFIVNAAIVYLLAPVFLHFVMALALLSAGYFMYSRSKELNNLELSIYGYGICLALWISSKEILLFLGSTSLVAWVVASILALIVLGFLLKYVEGFQLRQGDD